MKIVVNNEEMTVADGIKVSSLLEGLNMPTIGIAVAIGKSVTPRSEWESTIINEGDNITIIRATQGG